MLQKFNKEVYQRGRHCHCTLEMIKAFKENKTVCDTALIGNIPDQIKDTVE